MGYRNLLASGRALAFAAPVLAVLAVAALAVSACQRQAQDASAIPHTPIPKAEPRFAMAAEDGRIRYEGVVADAATRDAIIGALRSAAPEATGTLAVEPLTRPAPWAKALGPAAAALRRTGGKLTFADRRIELAGGLTQEQRATLYRRIRTLYPGYELVGAFQGADLRHALPDEGDADTLLAFLAARPIEFRAGTGMLTQASVEALARAARGLRAAGPAARVEIRVRPEAGGDPDERSAVARQRADAILTQLALRGVAPGRVRAVVAPAEAGSGPIVEFAPFRAEATDAGGPGETDDSPATNAGAAPTPDSAAGPPAAEAPPPAADPEPAGD
jgi:hypothetical protein